MIAKAIYKLHEQLADQEPRAHLGASQIGHKCERALWYGFRWAFRITFSGQKLRLFETGHLEEARIIKELRLAGYYVVTRENGHQLGFKEHDGHFAGSVDGKIQLEGYKTGQWYLLEIKTHSLKSFEYLKVNGVKKAKPVHFAQMQIYMRHFDLKKGLYLSVCKDNEEIYEEIISYSNKNAIDLRAKALRVIQSENVPERLSNVIKGCFECERCDYQKNCHRLDSSQLPEFNCRTCIHSSPSTNQSWKCVKQRKEIQEQRGCSEHLFIPALVPADFIGANDENEFQLQFRTIEGKTIINKVGKGLEVLENA